MTETGKRTLLSDRGGYGSRDVDVYYSTDSGSVIVYGQSLGSGREYEWGWSIKPSQFAMMREVLGAGSDDDLVEYIADHYAGDAFDELEGLFREHIGSGGFWSRSEEP